MGEAARRRVSEDFTGNGYCHRMVAIYRNLLEAKASATKTASGPTPGRSARSER